MVVPPEWQPYCAEPPHGGAPPRPTRPVGARKQEARAMKVYPLGYGWGSRKVWVSGVFAVWPKICLSAPGLNPETEMLV